MHLEKDQRRRSYTIVGAFHLRDDSGVDSTVVNRALIIHDDFPPFQRLMWPSPKYDYDDAAVCPGLSDLGSETRSHASTEHGRRRRLLPRHLGHMARWL